MSAFIFGKLAEFFIFKRCLVFTAVCCDILRQGFISYLDNRLQRVVIDGKSSDWLPVTSGVSQGSLLGPALFVLFINDMPSVLSHSSTLALFADDAKCFRAIKSHTDCALLH